jgi:hypothetical protein
VAAGDALDQALADLDAQAQERAQRRVPAPQPPRSPPVASTAAGGVGRPASTPAPISRGGPTLLQRIGQAATSVVDTIVPGLGTTLGMVAQHPQGAVGVASGILRSPVTAAAGLADFGADVAHAVTPKADPRNYSARLSPAGVQFRYSPTTDTYSKFGRDLTPLGHSGDDNANEISSNIASLAIGYGAAAKLARFAGVAPKIEQVVQGFGNPLARSAASLAVRAGGGGMVDAMIMDPETERFSNILQKVGVHTEFTDWLAHKDGEGKLEGRFKNAIEGTGLGAAADGLFQAGRYWRARLRGDHAEADAIQAELAAKHEGEVPDYIIDEHPGITQAPTDTPSYVGGWEESETGAIRPVYEEDPLKGASPEAKAQAADDGIEKPASRARPRQRKPEGQPRPSPTSRQPNPVAAQVAQSARWTPSRWPRRWVTPRRPTPS